MLVRQANLIQLAIPMSCLIDPRARDWVWTVW